MSGTSQASPGTEADRIHYTGSAFTPHREFWARTARRAAAAGASNPGAPDERGERRIVSYALDTDAAKRLQALTGGNRLVRLMHLTGALGVVLARYSGTETITLVTPQLAAGPAARDLWPLPMVLDVPAGLTPAALLGEVRGQFKDAYTYQEYPWHDFQLFPSGHAGAAAAILDPELHRGWGGEPGLPPLVVSVEDGATPSLVASYAPPLEEEELKGLLARAARLASRLDEPERPIRDADLLLEGEEAALLTWSQGKDGPAGLRTISAMFEDAVARCADRPAVIHQNAVTSYAELQRMVDRLAGHFAADCRLAAGDIVAISADRGPATVAAALAVMKCGAAYLPIDLAAPAERVQRVLSLAEVKLLVIDSARMDAIPDGPAAVFVLDLQLPGLAEPDAVPCRATPDCAAYVMATSGSSGEPKAVVVQHAAAANMLGWRVRHYGLRPEHVNLQLAPLWFDSSVADIFSFLAAGAALLLPAESERLSPDHIRALIERHGPTHMMVVPSIYANLLPKLGRDYARLACVTVAGESVGEGVVRAHFESCPETRLVNEYGPAENAVCSSCADLRPGDRITIGRPIDNCSLYILTPDGSLAAPGFAGEICLAGAGLAQLYLGDAAKTAARFRPHPFESERRIYLSGDIGRWTDDGRVEIIGRADDQVKLKGVRIELEEVRAAILRTGPWIDAQVAMETIEGEPSLIAAVVAASGAEADVEAIRPALAARLPAPFVPRFIAAVAELPLTSNGKLDREALGALAARQLLDARAEIVPAATDTERLLTEIFAGLFEGGEPIGTNQNYFALGGDSIRLIQLIGEVERRTAVTLEPQDVYAQPTIAQLAEILDRRQLSSPARGRESAPPAPAAPAVEAEWPASAIALGMIYHAAQHPGSGVYHDQTVLRLTLPGFEPTLLARAVEHVVGRHPALRSAFRLAGGEAPRQVAFASLPVDIGYEERRSLSAAAQEAAVRDYLEADRARPFDVSAAPLWRMRLFDFADDRLVLCFSLHHAILDGWSSAVFWDEVRTAYASLVEGAPIRLPDLTISHEDVAAAQEAIANDPAVREFWRSRVGGASPLSLRRRLRRAPAGANVMISRQTAIPRAVSKGVDALATQIGVNRKAVFLAAFVETLSLYSFEHEFLVGVVETTRPLLPGADRILGCFLNTVPYRHTVTAAPAAERVRAVFERLAEQLRASRLPLPAILDAVAGGGRGGDPLFELVFAYVDFHVLDNAADSFASADPDLSSDRSHTPLDIIVSATGGEDRMIVNADPAYADATFVERLAGRFLSVLEGIVSKPAVPLSRHSLLGEEEWRLRGGSLAPAFYSVVAGWLAQAARRPEAAAIIDIDGSVWTYSALEHRARSIAASLSETCGISAGSRVGLLLPVSGLAIASILAVHLLGASYVPVDASTPLRRTEAIFNDAGVNAIATHSALAGTLNGARPVLLVDREAESGRVAAATLDPASECYVIYTSGSTGTPKGVRVGHRGVSNMVAAQMKAFGIGESEIVGQFASLAFDASVSEVFTALCAGATLALVPPEVKGDVKALQRFLAERKVSVITLPPALLAMIDPQALSGLKTLVSAGEELPPETAARVPDTVALINAYGPTEASVCATICHVPSPRGEPAQAPIGRPVANSEVMILDRSGAPVAQGGVGEIAIGGAGLALGYTRASEEAERFVPHPAVPGQRLYRTGDLAWVDEEGLIHFHGRTGGQVKLRGYRVEPQEVAEVLRRQEGVIDAAAFLAPSGDVLWAAVAGEDASPDEAALRRGLETYLPAYMVPARILLVEALPLTRNGKVDAAALAAAITASEAPPSAETGVETAAEQRLLAIWRRVLGRPDLGVDARFFEAGGHSLQAVKLCAEIHEELGIEIPLKRLFEHDSVRRLVATLESSTAGALPPITPRRDRLRSPASHHQLRVLSASLSEGGSADYSITTALRLTGPLDKTRFAGAVATLLRRHDILRTRFSITAEGDFVQHAADEWTLGDYFHEETLAGGAAWQASAENLLRSEQARGLDLFAGPLFRLVLGSDGQNRHIVILSQHHSITDGWSLDILVDELARSYQGQPLPELELQYGDFAAWHGQLLDSGWRKAELAFWTERFGDGVPACRLPGDGGSPDGRRAGLIERALRPATAAWLLGAAPSQITSYQRGLLATFLFLYGQLGRRRLVVGSPFVARPLPALQRQVGLYANTLPLSIELSGAWSLKDAEGAVAKLTAEHMDHALYPLDLLTWDLRAQGLLDRDARPFHVGFTWTEKREAPAIAGVAVEEWDSSQEALKADLWIYLVERNAGVQLIVEYDASRFSEGRAGELVTDLDSLLNRLPSIGDDTLDQIVAAGAPSQAERAPAPRKWSALDQLTVGGSAVRGPSHASVRRTGVLHAGVAPIWEAERPLRDPAQWLGENWDAVRRDIESRGAVLLRNAGVGDAAGLTSVMRARDAAPLEYFFRSTPRTPVSGNVYTATEYPADQTIPQHNENSYASHWPRLLWFLCVEPAPEGGETPLSDSREVYQAIPIRIRDEFVARGLVYERNFHPGIDLSWQEVFQTEDREDAEARCAAMGIAIRWSEDGLPSISHPGPVVETHPATGEAVWFNQAHLFHPSSLDPEIAAGLDQLTAGRAPRSVRFADGGSIAPEDLEEIRRAYRACTAASEWRKGDLLIVDNLLTAHGRRPFRGRRAISVAMSGMPGEVHR